MPKYSFRCIQCENRFEVEASIKEKEEGGEKFNCPKCNSKNTKPVFNLLSFFSKDKNQGGGGCCCKGKCK